MTRRGWARWVRSRVRRPSYLVRLLRQRRPPDMTEEILRVANEVAAEYRARASYVDFDDLVAEAARVCVEAARTHDPRRGPFGAYAAGACRRALWDYVVRQASPASAKKPERRELIESAKRVDTFEWQVREAAGGDSRDLGAVIDELEWRARVRRRVAELAERQGLGWVGELWLLDRDGDGQQAARAAVPEEKRRWRAVEALRAAITDDLESFHLWRDLWK